MKYIILCVGGLEWSQAPAQGPSGRGLGVRRSVVVGPQSPHPDAAVVGGSEDVVVVGGDGVDGAVVSLHLPDEIAAFC